MASFTSMIAELPDSVGVRVGKILTTSPLVVSLGGGVINTPGRLASYTPVAGHVVALIRQDSTWLILGQVVQ
jgi:hypothetical protein